MLFMRVPRVMATSTSPNPNIFLTPNMISVDIEGFYVHLCHTQYTGARSMSVMAHPLCGQRAQADRGNWVSNAYYQKRQYIC